MTKEKKRQKKIESAKECNKVEKKNAKKAFHDKKS